MNTTPGRSARSSVTLVLDYEADTAAAPADSPHSAGPMDDGAGRRVLVLGHRGMPGPRRRENTVRAVEAALNGGADGVEVDVRLSGDGVLICSHDPLVRTARGAQLVSATSAAQLRAAGEGDGGLATVHEVIAAVWRYERHRRHESHAPVRLVVEAKPTPDRTAARRTAAALQPALEAARSAGVAVTVSSFDPVLLALVRNGTVHVRTALLGREAEPVHTVLLRAARAGHEEAHLSVAAIRHAPHAMALACQLGIGVTVWTVNSREDLRRLARWGVDAVITDNIVAARVVMAEAVASGMADGAAC